MSWPPHHCALFVHHTPDNRGKKRKTTSLSRIIFSNPDNQLLTKLKSSFLLGFTGSQEVRGSNPLSSTKGKKGLRVSSTASHPFFLQLIFPLRYRPTFLTRFDVSSLTIAIFHSTSSANMCLRKGVSLFSGSRPITFLYSLLLVMPGTEPITRRFQVQIPAPQPERLRGFL